MSLAICIRCGNQKRSPSQRCKRCGFEPASDIEYAQSLILSLDYEIDGDYEGKSKKDLIEIGRSFGSGPYAFDDAEVRRVMDQAKAALSVSRAGLAKDLVRWLWKPLLLLIVAVFIIKKHYFP